MTFQLVTWRVPLRVTVSSTNIIAERKCVQQTQTTRTKMVSAINPWQVRQATRRPPNRPLPRLFQRFPSSSAGITRHTASKCCGSTSFPWSCSTCRSTSASVVGFQHTRLSALGPSFLTPKLA